VRVGVCIVPTDPWPIAVAQARHVEALGFDHLWTYDHLSWQHYRDRSWFGAIPWLTGLAVVTDRIRLGTLVCSPNFREPLTLAKDAIAIDHVSGGRFVLGVGAGGVGWDATVFGGDPLPPRARTDRFVEMVEALDGLLTHGTYSYTGAHYVIVDARTMPGPLQQPRLPLAVAAAGPRALALAARFGDAWVTIGDPWHDGSAAGTERAVRDQVRRFEDACVTAGRDPGSLDRVLLAGAGDERPIASAAAFEDFAGRYAAVGITDVVVHHPRAEDPHWDDPPDVLDAIAGEVLPRVRESA
jgi:alkanesulfonate monooxygenase SsuD/methylene tetrahydromethanopterin reductase-like flavin-dependent oxidoreductase (luciferase family)